ncbi:MAG: DUF92 domain-containing protein [bacterium]
MRLLYSLLPNLLLGILGIRLNAFDLSGFLLGLVTGWVITYAFGFGGFLVLLSFVTLGSLTTRISYSRKESLGINEPAGGRRTWRSALGNLSVPAFLSVYYIARGSDQLSVAFVASLATASCDTVASEIGKAYSTRVVDIVRFRFAPVGTSGGISAKGTMAGAAGSLVVASVGAASNLIGWNQLFLIVFSAIVGTISESLIRSATGIKAPQFFNILNTAIGAFVALALFRFA